MLQTKWYFKTHNNDNKSIILDDNISYMHTLQTLNIGNDIVSCSEDTLHKKSSFVKCSGVLLPAKQAIHD